MENERNSEDRIRKEGTKKQWITHAADKVMANLSPNNCDLILSLMVF